VPAEYDVGDRSARAVADAAPGPQQADDVVDDERPLASGVAAVPLGAANAQRARVADRAARANRCTSRSSSIARATRYTTTPAAARALCDYYRDQLRGIVCRYLDLQRVCLKHFRFECPQLLLASVAGAS
jgi:hypothetical protein